jgi:glycosyltransferase involved in cell wall biosynthesis
MSKDLLISIVIPTLNSQASIAICIESIINQDFDRCEVLIIDGGSSDSTITIAESFSLKASRLRIISEKDKGIYDAMNKGITLARGEYLYFLGSDDTLYTGTVLNDIAEQIIQTGAKVLYGNVLMHGSNSYVRDGHIHDGEFNLKRLLSHNICHQSIFYHNEVFKKVGVYSLKYPVFADYDLNLRSFANYKFVYSETIVANFNVGGTSTQITDEAFEKDKLKNIIKYFFGKLFTTAFVDCRLFIKQAAFSGRTGIEFGTRLYCMLAYMKLKTQSLLR